MKAKELILEDAIKTAIEGEKKLSICRTIITLLVSMNILLIIAVAFAFIGG